MVEVKREENWYRPLFVEGKEIDRYVFFANGEKICVVNSGILQNNNERDLLSIHLDDLKRKNKEDLAYKGDFYMSNGKDFQGNTKYALYIYCPTYIKLDDIKEEIDDGCYFIYSQYKFQIENVRNEYNRIKKEYENNTYQDVIIKTFKESYQTDKYKEKRALEDEVEKMVGRYVSFSKIEEIAKMYNKYLEK